MAFDDTLERIRAMVAPAARSTWQAIKDNAKVVILTVIVTLVFVYFFWPSNTITVPGVRVPYAVVDERAVEDAREEMQEIIDEKQSFIDRLLNLQHIGTPESGEVGRPRTNPIETQIITIPIKAGSVDSVQRVVAPYDFPIAVFVETGKVVVLTNNPYLEITGQPYQKTYRYSRETSNFELALVPSYEASGLDGIRLNWKERFFSFDGLYVGAESELPTRFAASLSAEFSMYERLKFQLTALSYPGVRFTARYRLF